MSAFFTAEFGLNPTDNNLSGNANMGLFNRQSFVGIAQKGIGRAAIGTQNTPVHMAVGRTDPGQQNNMVGSIIYTTNASQGAGQTAQSYTVRYNNALTLQTERLAGFQVNAIYSNNNGSSNNTITGLPFNANVANTATTGAAAGSAATAGQNALGRGESDNTAWGIGANYVFKKLNVDLAYQNSKQTSFRGGIQVPTSGVPGAAPVIGATVPNVMGTSMGQTQMYGGAMYDFGILKAYAGYINTKYESNLNSNAYVSRSGQQLGVRGNWTPKIESWASLGNGAIKAGNGILAAAAPATQNFTAWQLGTNYILSKRTNLYAIYGQTQVSASSVNISEGASSYGIGARHTF
jgi:predicted porin